MTTSSTTHANRGSVAIGLAAVLFFASGGLIGGYFSVADSGPRRGARESGPSRVAEQGSLPKIDQPRQTGALGRANPPTAAALEETAVATDLVESNVRVRAAGRETERTWRQLGAQERNGELVLDRATASRALRALKAVLDRAPRNARIDVEARKVWPSRSGVGLDVYGSLGYLEAAASAGDRSVELATVELPAEVTVQDLGVEDISHVLAVFSTKFAIIDRVRNDNLKLAASKLHGRILKPDEIFSFNKIVGARTEKEGYKIAGVIDAGEMVDGLAGGTCQISTTLHGAAFFAGLEIVQSSPHSRPSTYVEMGLDATVVYPHTDLKLRNRYPFPVVISYKVARGEAVVEVLGKERPYDLVEFEREIVEELEFDTVTREDNQIAFGHMLVDQEGFPGYKVRRLRNFYKGEEVVKQEEWELIYYPVTEYVRTGANPDPNLVPPQQKPLHGPQPPQKAHLLIAR